MGSPNATVYRLRGVGLILNELACVGCCRGAANVQPVRAGSRPAGADGGGGGEVAGRAATDTGRERTASTLAPQATRIPVRSRMHLCGFILPFVHSPLQEIQLVNLRGTFTFITLLFNLLLDQSSLDVAHALL